MKIVTQKIHRKTNGAPDLIDLTHELHQELKQSGLKQGMMTVFVIGSTAGITTFEYEPGLVKDMARVYEQIAPSNRRYAHDDTWHDDNGFSHVRAAIQGCSLAVPFEKAKLMLGTWQQVVLADFDNRPRDRTVVVQMIGQ